MVGLHSGDYSEDSVVCSENIESFVLRISLFGEDVRVIMNVNKLPGGGKQFPEVIIVRINYS